MKRTFLNKMVTFAAIFVTVASAISAGGFLRGLAERPFLAKTQEFAMTESTEAPYRVVRFEVTMYSTKGSLTANNTPPDIGTAAAPATLPYGTEIYLDTVFADCPEVNDNIYVVDDRGASLKSSFNEFGEETIQICIWTPNEQDALKFGRRIMYGRIY